MREREVKSLGFFSALSPSFVFGGWRLWWTALSTFQKIIPLAAILIYWLLLYLVGGLASDHISIGVLILVLSYGGPRTRIVLSFLMPLLLTAIIYDSQRYYGDYLRGRIRVSEPYDFDKKFFGITTQDGVLTPNEWWQLHTHWTLDLVTGFFYLFFIAIFVLIAGYFQFWLPRQGGTSKLSALDLRVRAPRIMWGFLWVNLLGYSTYYWYPAAPPWYVTLYGLGPVNMDAKPNPAGCIRFDELLGTHFFTGMYGKSADIFGAIPSLHIAYPLLAVLFAFQFGALRKFSIFFYLIMCFSAVYLNHHYILDIIWGSAYAILIWWMTNWWEDRKLNRSSDLKLVNN